MELNVVEMKDDLPQIPQASEFPHALAAMESMEPSLQEAESEAQWTIGDAVLQDIPIQPVGVKDGSGEQLNRLAVLAESRGYQRYSVAYLRRLRSISYRFPDIRKRRERERICETADCASLSSALLTAGPVATAGEALGPGSIS